MNVLDAFPRQRSDLAARVIEGEAVVVTPADGSVHELDAVATFVWEGCDGRNSGRALARRVTEAYEVETEVAERDVAGLLQELQAKGLVELLSAPP